MAIMLITCQRGREAPNATTPLDVILNAHDHQVLADGVYLVFTSQRVETMFASISPSAMAKDRILVTMLKHPYRLFCPQSMAKWAAKKMKERKQAPKPPETLQSDASRLDSRNRSSIDSDDEDIPF